MVHSVGRIVVPGLFVTVGLLLVGLDVGIIVVGIMMVEFVGFIVVGVFVGVGIGVVTATVGCNVVSILVVIDVGTDVVGLLVVLLLWAQQ